MRTRARRLLLLCALCSPTALAEAPAWQMLRAGSHLGFVATWEGTDFHGEFREFSADIRFAPDALQASRFEVIVDVTSADTGSVDRDEAMAEPEWFDYAGYPQARFLAEQFEALADGRYVAHGELTIKGRTQRIRLPFDWRAENGQARLHTEIVLQRTDFGIGEGEWAEGELIGIDVRVVGDLTLERRR